MQKLKPLESSNYQRQVIVFEPDICPLCGMGMSPLTLSTKVFLDFEDEPHVAEMYQCPCCRDVFISTNRIVPKDGGYTIRETWLLQQEYCGPKNYIPQEFPEEIETLSPQFVEIYNQAAEAEAAELDEISGIGYRKALEFLVKDFCIHKNPDSADDIKRTMLGSCIKNWIDDKRINTLAERAVWIGNDETHYVRKHTDLDIKDMKRFLKALLGFISSELVYEEAEQVQKV